MRVLVGAALGCAAAVAGIAVAAADGEAGVVIDWGDGRVTTHCVAFSGDGIRGDDLLSGAGLAIDAFRAGGPSVVCAIEGEGCTDSGSFNSCFCECAQGGSDCTYWAFFTRDYDDGAWRYSARAFDLSTASDGDMHAWRWGDGSLSSAPPPAEVSFEQVCGHPPQGGVQPTAIPTLGPAATTPAEAGQTGTPAPTEDVVSTMPAGPTMAAPTFRPGTAQPTAMPPATGERDDDGGGGGGLGIAAFAGVTVVLAAAIGGAAWWRRRGGS